MFLIWVFILGIFFFLVSSRIFFIWRLVFLLLLLWRFLKTISSNSSCKSWIKSRRLFLRTDDIPQEYLTSSTVLVLSLHSTDGIPLQYWSYTLTILMLSPTVLNILHSTGPIPSKYGSYPFKVRVLSLHSTDGIPPQYWWYSSTVLVVHPYSTDVIPHST